MTETASSEGSLVKIGHVYADPAHVISLIERFSDAAGPSIQFQLLMSSGDRLNASHCLHDPVDIDRTRYEILAILSGGDAT